MNEQERMIELAGLNEGILSNLMTKLETKLRDREVRMFHDYIMKNFKDVSDMLSKDAPWQKIRDALKSHGVPNTDDDENMEKLVEFLKQLHKK